MKRITRRKLLRRSVIVGLAAVAASCTPSPVSEIDTKAPTSAKVTDPPTATRAQPTVTPSVTPQPTATETEEEAMPAGTETEEEPTPTEGPRHQVALIRTSERMEGVQRSLALLGAEGPDGERVLLKPNYNSADPAPGSTHNDVLRTIVDWLREQGAGDMVLADRSGMGQTRQVLEQKGIFSLGQELGFEVQVLDELEAEEWEMVQPPNSHWREGFPIARLAQETPYIVQACCLKTHRYGGHFTLSLKNSVGLVAKVVPGQSADYMGELHNSPHQRLMIAEINAAYTPDLIVMDGVEAFVRGGPARGEQVQANVFLASRDRVALDAVGVAILRHFGTTPEVSGGSVFEQEQIARAVELGLGAREAEEIEILTEDEEGETFAGQIQEILRA
ncbi:MAG: DUF362 domain-containing protein [Anaerolineales bacterium]